MLDTTTQIGTLEVIIGGSGEDHQQILTGAENAGGPNAAELQFPVLKSCEQSVKDIDTLTPILVVDGSGGMADLLADCTCPPGVTFLCRAPLWSPRTTECVRVCMHRALCIITGWKRVPELTVASVHNVCRLVAAARPPRSGNRPIKAAA